jgi:DNA-binding LytR/AlgR family response regulator
VLAIGAVATVSAVLLGIPVWAWGFREAAGPGPGAARPAPIPPWVLHALAALAFAAVWVWLQYALNPYRVRPVGEAMLVSRSLAWQAMAGLWLYGSVAMSARAAGARARPEPHAERNAPASLDEPSSVADGTAPPCDRLTIRLGERTIVVPADRIERLQAADDYVAVHTDGRRLLASHRISELAERLDPATFVRVHRSHIVNLTFVDALDHLPGDRIRVRLRSGATVPASRTGSALLRARLA